MIFNLCWFKNYLFDLCWYSIIDVWTRIDVRTILRIYLRKAFPNWIILIIFCSPTCNQNTKKYMFVAPSNVIKFYKLKKGWKLRKLKSFPSHTEWYFTRAEVAEVNKTKFYNIFWVLFRICNCWIFFISDEFSKSCSSLFASWNINNFATGQGTLKAVNW